VRQVLDMIEHGFAKRGINLTTLPARLLYRSAYVVLISFVACTIPFFGVRGGHPPARLACAGHVQTWAAHAPTRFSSRVSFVWLHWNSRCILRPSGCPASTLGSASRSCAGRCARAF